MIELHTIKPSVGSRKKSDRIGRGNASGHGTTAGKGTKGQRARSGGRNKLKLKGLKQMLLSFPKNRGFKSRKPEVFDITIGKLAGAFSVPATLKVSDIKKVGLAPRIATRVKIVMGGETPKAALNLVGMQASAAAKAAIEKAGGTVK